MMTVQAKDTPATASKPSSIRNRERHGWSQPTVHT
jgi:hypothetical protein